MKKHLADIMRQSLLLIIVAVSGVFTACDNSGSKVINIAFQSEENGRWGMMTTNGKVIFEDEFEREPSASVNGYFTVKNGDGLWEIYSAEEKPKQVGGEYLYVGPFIGGVAPVVEKDKPVTLIDTDGKVVVTLDKLSGKTVKAVSATFSYGRAIFMIENEEIMDGKVALFGLIDTEGDVLIEPEYRQLVFGADMVLGFSEEECKKMEEEDRDIPGEMIVFDLNGKEQSRINIKKNDITDIGACAEGLLKVKIESGRNSKMGLMDKKGKWVVKPSTKVKDVGDVSGKKFVYYDGERYGLMNFDGDVLIRAKYNYLKFVTEKVLAATEYNNGDREDKLIDLEGNDIGNDTWEVLIGLGDGNIMARESSNSWIIIDAKGKTVSDKNHDIYGFNLGYGGNWEWIYSDYFDIEAMLSKLSLSKNGACGMTLSSSVETIVKVLEQEVKGTDDPEDHRYDAVFYYRKNLGETTADIFIAFDGRIAEGVKGMKQETDYFGRVHRYETIVDYKWTNAKVKMVGVNIPTGGKMRGKESDVYMSVVSQVAGFGKVSKQGEKFTIVSTGSDRCILVADESEDRVELVYVAVPADTFKDLTDDIVNDQYDLRQFIEGSVSRAMYSADYGVEEIDSCAVDICEVDTCSY